ncbi:MULTISPECIES: OprD family porin [unclassified Lentimonas]|nr:MULTISPECIES: OprD family porin [unclassified Lentimonas]CAA6694987.1 Unannotated [Lentimonas sp. CC19]CAA6695346.1 Unannotated [Lentimonas sp. CC10]CAA7072018.1 Unannotated [Lentimonas sp. CC11]
MKELATLIAATFVSTALTTFAAPVQADSPSASIVKPINDLGYGTFSGRVQLLAMYRDFEDTAAGDYGDATTLGVVLNYQSPEFSGFDVGAAYNYAFTLEDGNNTDLLHNDDINVINEAWARYNFEAFDLEGTQAMIGRQINNGEVFRKDDYRQKARALEAAQFTTTDISDLALTIGHAIELSNWMDSTSTSGVDRWDFNDFGDVFGTDYDTDGVTWVEAIYTGVEKWEIALFNACAWDVTNLIGTRIQYNFSDDATLTGYYRHEGDIGKAESRNSDAYGLSYSQKVGQFTLEPGYFGVHGSKLRFQETTTGINHPLGASMIIYANQFNGGAQTAYFKVTTKVNKTVLYALYNYTWQDNADYDAQELNFVAKHPITDRLTASFKGAFGHRDGNSGNGDTTATDARLFLTYMF